MPGDPSPLLAPATDAIDHALSRAALEKRASGQMPTARETEALRRVQKAEDEGKRWLAYHTVPQKHYRAMAGRTTKVLIEHAQRFRIPFGPTIDIAAVVRRFHELLIENRHRFRGGVDDESDPLLTGATSPALERYRDEKAKLAKLDRLQREGELLDRGDMHEILARVAARFRAAGEAMQRRFGVEAGELMCQAIDDAEHVLEGLFGDDGDGGGQDDTE